MTPTGQVVAGLVIGTCVGFLVFCFGGPAWGIFASGFVSFLVVFFGNTD